jgi:hypothetical protein
MIGMLLVFTATSSITPLAHGQDEGDFDAEMAEADAETSESEEEELDLAETPPQPEAPYPDSVDEDLVQAAASPTPAPAGNPKKTSGATLSSNPLVPTPPPPPLPGIGRPLKVTADGEYLYGTQVETPQATRHPGIPMPKSTSRRGDFFYDRHEPGTEAPSTADPSTERPVEITSRGEFGYSTESTGKDRSASLRVGAFNPPNISNPENPDITFSSMYGDAPQFGLIGDYEMRLTSFFGRLGVKLVSGLFVASGNGRFRTARADGLDAEEKFTFLLFPNQLTATYKFQYAERQVLVPFVEGGAGYFTFAEIRDDQKGPRFGGAAVTVAAGGLNLLLDYFDRAAIRQLDAYYGINHVWLTAEARAIVGLNGNFDFTSIVFSSGVVLEF